jgi:hypothetical protein
MRPISKTSPVGRVSVNLPPAPGSNAMTPGGPGVNANRSFGRHQRPISR